MKKILTLAAGALLVVCMASCSNKNNTSGVDNTALKTTLAKEWALKDGYNDDGSPNVDKVYGADIINKNNEEVTGAHFTLRLPSAESYDSMVRTHLVELSKAQTATGHISSNYGVMSSAILSFKTQISAAITDEVKTSITSKISSFEAVVQENYSSSLDVKEKEENQAFYAAYIPALFSYYSGKEDSTLQLLSFVFIPVKSEILTATVSGDTKTYSSDFYNKTKELQYNWTTSGSVIVDKK